MWRQNKNCTKTEQGLNKRRENTGQCHIILRVNTNSFSAHSTGLTWRIHVLSKNGKEAQWRACVMTLKWSMTSVVSYLNPNLSTVQFLLWQYILRASAKGFVWLNFRVEIAFLLLYKYVISYREAFFSKLTDKKYPNYMYYFDISKFMYCVTNFQAQLCNQLSSLFLS